ncbi:MAG TPA: hypothetical protein PLN07_04650 [Myxococcota bacterium]|jgi:hypothetical protein|nr:hypothetical protein [Oligoflexales bacterium]HQL56877.1 hypothetical protein [Myxococcota bacterium]
MSKSLTTIVLVLGLLAFSQSAYASKTSANTMFHWPVSSISVKDSYFAIEWDAPWQGNRITLHYRNGSEGDFQSIDLVQINKVRWEVMLPAQSIVGPSFEYWIESLELDGSSVPRFGSLEHPQVAKVVTSAANKRRNEYIKDHKGRRNVLDLSFRHYDFGRPGTMGARSQDSFNMLELSYTYRLLLPMLYQLNVGFATFGDKLGYTLPYESTYRPGAYYAFIKPYWEFWDWLGIEGVFLVGAGPHGVVGGGGLTFRVGPIRASHVDFGFWGMGKLGLNFNAKFVWTGIPHVLVDLQTEIITMPDNEEVGFVPSVKLTGLLPLGIRVHGLIGYGIRKGHQSGWINWGVGLGWEF